MIVRTHWRSVDDKVAPPDDVCRVLSLSPFRRVECSFLRVTTWRVRYESEHGKSYYASDPRLSNVRWPSAHAHGHRSKKQCQFCRFAGPGPDQTALGLVYPVINAITKRITNIQNNHLAIVAAAPAIPPKPSIAATSAITRNITAHRNMCSTSPDMRTVPTFYRRPDAGGLAFAFARCRLTGGLPMRIHVRNDTCTCSAQRAVECEPATGDRIHVHYRAAYRRWQEDRRVLLRVLAGR